MDVDEPGQQSKQRELQRVDLEQAPHCFPSPLVCFQSAYRCLLGAFSRCIGLLLSVFVSASLLHVPLLVPPVLFMENWDPPSSIGLPECSDPGLKSASQQKLLQDCLEVILERLRRPAPLHPSPTLPPGSSRLCLCLHVSWSPVGASAKLAERVSIPCPPPIYRPTACLSC